MEEFGTEGIDGRSVNDPWRDIAGEVGTEPSATAEMTCPRGLEHGERGTLGEDGTARSIVARISLSERCLR